MDGMLVFMWMLPGKIKHVRNTVEANDFYFLVAALLLLSLFLNLNGISAVVVWSLSTSLVTSTAWLMPVWVGVSGEDLNTFLNPWCSTSTISVVIRPRSHSTLVRVLLMWSHNIMSWFVWVGVVSKRSCPTWLLLLITWLIDWRPPVVLRSWARVKVVVYLWLLSD